MTILGVVMLALGAFLVIKTEWMMTNFGRISWFEDKLGSSGGSRTGYKIIGVVILFLGVIFVTGSGEGFMSWLLAPLLRYN